MRLHSYRRRRAIGPGLGVPKTPSGANRMRPGRRLSRLLQRCLCNQELVLTGASPLLSMTVTGVRIGNTSDHFSCM